VHPADAVDLLDRAVEIPMVGHDTSLNATVAGSLVLYKLAALRRALEPAVAGGFTVVVVAAIGRAEDAE
jgi:hypothetical protein